MSDFLAIQKFLLVNQVRDTDDSPQGKMVLEQIKRIGTWLYNSFKGLDVTHSSKNCYKPIDGQVTAVDMDQFDYFTGIPAYTPSTTPGYFVFSTAPFNTDAEDPIAGLLVDETPAMEKYKEVNSSEGYKRNTPFTIRDLDSSARKENFKKAIKSIADDLVKNNVDGTSELVIAIHGYSTEQANVRRWYKKIFQYVNQEPVLKSRKNLVFVGYRWSSEQPELNFKNFGIILTSLPAPLQVLPLIPIAFFSVILIVALAFNWLNILPVLWGLLVLSTISIISIVASLIILRFIVYFRDNYRANHFAVPDLVEFLRQLNRAFQKSPDLNFNNPLEGCSKFKVNLNFIAHSMGGFVATNTIRILSDVFEQGAVEARPSSDIGKYFCLKRLVLVSPDIPKLAIEDRRANFLASSLRRFDEAYLFSNEADLALRLASTAANYFSFPAKTRKSGYRLGNVTINPEVHKEYGIVNLKPLEDTGYSHPCDTGISAKEWLAKYTYAGHGKFLALNSLFESYTGKRPGDNVQGCQLTIADLFTYFDCTDYIEPLTSPETFNDFIKQILEKNKEKIFGFLKLKENRKYNRFIKEFKSSSRKFEAISVLSRGKGVSKQNPKTLTFLDHTVLILDYIMGRDVHGGYFAAPFTQELIYQLAFMGLHDVLDPYQNAYDDPRSGLTNFDTVCKYHHLQILLSPLHYQCVENQNPRIVKEAFIELIKNPPDQTR